MDDETDEFARLFRREYPIIAREIYLILGDWESARDITQEAFVRLVEQWAEISGYDRPGAWVRRVAIGLAANASRLRQRRLRVLPRLMGRSQEDLNIRDLDVLEALQALSQTQRAAVVLHYFEGLPGGEVAELLGCTEATVRVHLHQGRNRLRLLLGGTRDA